MKKSETAFVGKIYHTSIVSAIIHLLSTTDWSSLELCESCLNEFQAEPKVNIAVKEHVPSTLVATP